MIVSGLLLYLLAAQSPPASTLTEAALAGEWIAKIAKSGRVLTAGTARENVADPRKDVAPGAPPLLAFRYFEGAERHRFGKLDLMLDDAGH
jgi:hypothetical protein